MPPEHDLESALAWLEFSVADLESAEDLARLGGHPTVICYLCQQAAETAYKAYLAWCGDETIPRIHDLETLRRRGDARAPLRSPEVDTEKLTAYVVAGRYPGSRPIRREEVEPALAMARDVLAWVRQAIGPEE